MFFKRDFQIQQSYHAGWLILLAFLSTVSDSYGQKAINIVKIDNEILLDGRLDESDWQKAMPVSNFEMSQPVDDKPAAKKTEVRMLYTDRAIYIGATCWDDQNFVIQTLKRDAEAESDEFGLWIDPFGKQALAYAFGVNAFGAQSEALLTGDGGADLSWDNKWNSAVYREDDRWHVEIVIPFKSIKFDPTLDAWNINFWRLETGDNEIHTWANVPRQFQFVDMGYFGQLQWDAPPKKTGTNISLIPYTTASLTRLRTDLNPETNADFAFGGDAKIAVTPTMNVDLTFNPDFSQVEVDRQVTNLTRFNIFFPERRRFFLENADIFGAFGMFAETPFYSRRIGLDNSGQTVPIVYGARLTGNVSEKLRIGAFNMHTSGAGDRFGQNYSAAAFQQRVLKRSSIKGLFLNRQAYQDNEAISDNYGRNLGGEFAYSSEDGKWTSKLGYFRSFQNSTTDKSRHLYGRFDYNGQNFRTFLFIQNMGENYNADMGFNGRLFNFDPTTNQFQRIGFTQIGNMLNYYIYPKNSTKVNFHWAGLENFVYVNPDGTLNEWYTRLRHFIFFKNTSQLRFRLNNNYVDLIYPFALTETPLPAESYNWTEFNVQFNTDLRKQLVTRFFGVYGQFYNGTKLTYDVNVTLRRQPWGNFTLGIERNEIRLPDPYGNANFTLANARAEINFSTNLFWTTFLQYNTQANNFNVNSRIQWRYAPMSDIFLVYTDNYAVEGLFGSKSRSLVMKVNYWLTL